MVREVVTVEGRPRLADDRRPAPPPGLLYHQRRRGAIVVTRSEIARSLARPRVRVRGAGEAAKHQTGGRIDLTYTAAVWPGPTAFAEADSRRPHGAVAGGGASAGVPFVLTGGGR
jgi:hypothetical protein